MESPDTSKHDVQDAFRPRNVYVPRWMLPVLEDALHEQSEADHSELPTAPHEAHHRVSLAHHWTTGLPNRFPGVSDRVAGVRERQLRRQDRVADGSDGRPRTDASTDTSPDTTRPRHGNEGSSAEPLLELFD